MFKIYDGRENFYQWDIDRKIIVKDAEITQVHFCNRTDECSLVCETYTENGLNIVNVPNVLLQTDWRINVYAYDKNYTKFSKCFDVVKRSKPENYVYTETEVLNYDTLLERMDGIEESIGEAVNDYLEENPINVDLTGYATEDYVDEKVSNIDIPEVDLTPYAKKTDLNGYATETYVDNQIAAIPAPDLTPYAKKTDLNKYATQTYVTQQIAAIPEPDLSAYAKTTDLNAYAKKSDIKDMATEDYVNQQISNIDIPEVDLTGYATESYVDEAINRVNAGDVDLTGYATEDYVDEKIAAIPEVDLTDYAKKTDIPSVEGLATEAYVDEAISNIDIPEVDLTDYATKTYVAEAVLEGAGVYVGAEEPGASYFVWIDTNGEGDTLEAAEGGSY